MDGEEFTDGRRGRLSALLGALAVLLGVLLLGCTGYLFFMSALSPPADTPPPPARFEAADAQSAAPSEMDQVKAYVNGVNEIMRDREVVLEALSDVVKQQHEESPVDAALALVVRRRDVTQEALEAIEKKPVPARMAEVQRLYVKLLKDDISFTSQAMLALRANDVPRAVRVETQRDAEAQETLNAIWAAYGKAGAPAAAATAAPGP